MFVHNAICSSVSNVCLTTQVNVLIGNLERWLKTNALYFLYTWPKKKGNEAGKDGAAINRSCGECVMHIPWGFHHTFWERNTYTHCYGSKRESTPYSVLVIKLWFIQTMNLQEKKNDNAALCVFSECAKWFKCWWERKKWEDVDLQLV